MIYLLYPEAFFPFFEFLVSLPNRYVAVDFILNCFLFTSYSAV